MKELIFTSWEIWLSCRRQKQCEVWSSSPVLFLSQWKFFLAFLIPQWLIFFFFFIWIILKDSCSVMILYILSLVWGCVVFSMAQWLWPEAHPPNSSPVGNNFDYSRNMHTEHLLCDLRRSAQWSEKVCSTLLRPCIFCFYSFKSHNLFLTFVLFWFCFISFKACR